MKLIFKIVFLSLYIPMSFSQTCPDDLQVRGQMNSGNFIANRTLNTNTIISPNSQVELKAGISINLESEFSTSTNVEFLATIESCNNGASTENNALAWSSFPSSVTSGATYTTDLTYTLTQPGLIHVILADENWNKIGEAYTANLAAVTLH